MNEIFGVFSKIHEFNDFWRLFAPYVIALGIFSGIGLIGKVALFSKAEQPAWASFVPIYDMVITMRIVGRPDKHIFLFLIPIYNVYLGFKMCTEIASAFGKSSPSDYLWACILNVFYILHLAFSYSIEYQGPVFRKHLTATNNQMAVA
jgi:signal peptidase I